MLELSFVLKGLLIGLAVAAAIGPIALLCIQRTVMHGFKEGFSVGLGAALADSFYGAVAGFGLITLSNFLLHYQDLISMVGSMFLFWLGAKTFLFHANKEAVKEEYSSSLFKTFSSSFLLTLSSPMTILMFTAIFSGIGLMGIVGSGNQEGISLMLGVFLGSSTWWLILSGSVSIIREKISSTVLMGINLVSSSVLISFACYAFIKAYIHDVF